MTPPSNRLKLRRDTTDRWAAVDPVLAEGEPGVETDTGRFKLGDGETVWTELPYFVPAAEGASSAELSAHINNAEDPHPNYDDGRNFLVLYENAKV